MFTYTIYFIRDILTLIIKIILNIYAVILIRKYFYKSNLKPLNSVSGQMENSSGLNMKSYYIKVDRNLTFISITICVLSSFENIIYIVSYVMGAMSSKYQQAFLNVYFFTNVIIAIKHSSNLIILYLFNSVFKEEFKNFLLFRFK